MEHALGQCSCGQYHLTRLTPMREWWPLPDGETTTTEAFTITQYEGKHRSE